jgi:hypothetical protein
LREDIKTAKKQNDEDRLRERAKERERERKVGIERMNIGEGFSF